MVDERLPRRLPAVIITRRVPRVPRPAKHRTDVSDSHSVPSHPVAPDRTIDVYATCPRLPPCTVTDPDPVPPRFLPSHVLIHPPSTVYASEMLLRKRLPAVRAKRLVPSYP